MTTTPTADLDLSRASEVATAAVGVLPSVRRLTVGSPQPGQEEAYAAFPGVVVARVAGGPHGVEGHLGLLVGGELVSALASVPGDPTGVPLSLTAALQPTLDAAARALGLRAEAAVAVDHADGGSSGLEAGIGSVLGPHTVVPLIDGTATAAVLVSDSLLRSPEGAWGGDGFVAAPGHAPAGPTGGAAPRRGIELLNGVDMELTVELGRTRMAVRDLLTLAPGDVIELDRAAGSPADLLVNGRLIARGEVVVVDEAFGLRITEILDAAAG